MNENLRNEDAWKRILRKTKGYKTRANAKDDINKVLNRYPNAKSVYVPEGNLFIVELSQTPPTYITEPNAGWRLDDPVPSDETPPLYIAENIYAVSVLPPKQQG